MVTILTTPQHFPQIKEQLIQLIDSANLPLQCHWMQLDKVNNKALKQFFIRQSQLSPSQPPSKGEELPSLWEVRTETAKHCFARSQDKGYACVGEGNNLSELQKVRKTYNSDTILNAVLIAEVNKQGRVEVVLSTYDIEEINKTDKSNGKPKPTAILKKVSPEWHKLQRRVVTAGRKSELLLQACKLTADSRVIDGTAGFGHDSLIMASSGATVTMLEQNPIMALLLLLEKQRMQAEKNWQGLMGRLDIGFGNMVEVLQKSPFSLGGVGVGQTMKADVIYLDPMFPNDSYEGAKVGKEMQVLHNLAKPPTLQEEVALLTTAKSALTNGGRVVVKRPKNAPYLAGVPADESWENDVVRFDGYFARYI